MNNGGDAIPPELLSFPNAHSNCYQNAVLAILLNSPLTNNILRSASRTGLLGLMNRMKTEDARTPSWRDAFNEFINTLRIKTSVALRDQRDNIIGFKDPLYQGSYERVKNLLWDMGEAMSVYNVLIENLKLENARLVNMNFITGILVEEVFERENETNIKYTTQSRPAIQVRPKRPYDRPTEELIEEVYGPEVKEIHASDPSSAVPHTEIERIYHTPTMLWVEVLCGHNQWDEVKREFVWSETIEIGVIRKKNPREPKDEGSREKYSLTAVCYHNGVHFYSVVKHKDAWYEINDNSIAPKERCRTSDFPVALVYVKENFYETE